jgi:hypothetical protein
MAPEDPTTPPPPPPLTPARVFDYSDAAYEAADRAARRGAAIRYALAEMGRACLLVAVVAVAACAYVLAVAWMGG